MEGRETLIGMIVCLLVLAPSRWARAAGDATAIKPGHEIIDGLAQFKRMKYGAFVHYVWCGDYGHLTVDKNGQPPKSMDALADDFDAEGFARDLAAWQVEYVILTAWHANINPLFPSQTMKKWGLSNHACRRDLLRDVINACKARGIAVMFYTHPRDGHDLRGHDQLITGWGKSSGVSDPDWSQFNRAKWNDFTNDLYAELVDRYGKDIVGLYLDEGSGAGDSYRVVDYPRLRKTIKSRQPRLVMLQNFYGNFYTCDFGDKEYAHWGEFASRDGNVWPAYRMSVGAIFATSWWSAEKSEKNTVWYSAQDMFRYTVLEAGANTDGGGVQWAAGPYPGGGWETGVDQTMRQVGAYVKAVERSIKQTYPSTSFITSSGTKIADLNWGVATKSTDDKHEFIHVLKPPAGGSRTLQLPAPADGKKFATAAILSSGHAVSLSQDEHGLALTLQDTDDWDPVDTVIELAVAEDSPLTNVSQGKDFQASSFLNTQCHTLNATDGKTDGAYWAPQPVEVDPRPWGQADLGDLCNISRIEIYGSPSSSAESRRNLTVLASDTAGFEHPTILGSGPQQAASPLQPLVIRKAEYGAGDKQWDVTAKARAAVQGDFLCIHYGVDLLGYDPLPNVLKTLKVTYALDGANHVASVTDGQDLRIPESSGQPWKIDLSPPLRARYVRIAATGPVPSLRISEIKVFGKFN